MNQFKRTIVSFILLFSAASFASTDNSSLKNNISEDPLKLKQIVLIYPFASKNEIPHTCQKSIIQNLILNDEISAISKNSTQEQLESDMQQRIRKLQGYEINFRGLIYKGPSHVFEVEYLANEIVYAKLRGAYEYDLTNDICYLTMSFVDYIK